MPHKKRITLIIMATGIAIGIIILLILALWALCILCSNLQHPPNATNSPPDKYYSYNLTNNGTITSIRIHSTFPFILNNDVRYLEANNSDIEVKLWGTAGFQDVVFMKDGEDLIVFIKVSGSGVWLGRSNANEYIYLPRNWSYMVISTQNEHGTTYFENKSWNVEMIETNHP